MRLVVGIPSYGDWCSEFGGSLALLFAALASDERITSLRLSRCESTIIADGRNDIVRDALASGSTHILWLDSDMRFRPETIDRLIGHDLDIVACTYPKRRPPYVMTAQAIGGERIAPGEGLVEASHIGMGVALVKAAVFEAIGEPWFATPWVEADKRFVGEDVFWCAKARAHGFTVWVDRGASTEIGHSGRYTFTADNLPPG